jgi:Coenzyme PQQ synthesis protein D (PqqD)
VAIVRGEKIENRIGPLRGSVVERQRDNSTSGVATVLERVKNLHGAIVDGGLSTEHPTADITGRGSIISSGRGELEKTTTYAINAPDVIAETIEGETILVNLATGSYYSLEGSGTEIWNGLMNGGTPSVIADELALRYDGPAPEILAAIDQLVDELRAEQIVVETPATASETPVLAPAETGERRPFVSPTLKKFTDMQAIILLDPVHEVDQRGWPHPAEEDEARAAG